MATEGSPLDFDDPPERDDRSSSGPGRGLRGVRRDPPGRRPGHVFGDDPAAGEAAAAAFERSAAKWRPGAQTPGLGNHDAFLASPTRLEITTPLEWLFAGAGVGCFGLAFVLFFHGLETSRRGAPADPETALLLAIAGGVFVLLWTATDNHYLTNPSRRRIDYRFKCLGVEWTRPQLEGREVEIVAVDCVAKSYKPKHGPRRYWKEYTVYAWHLGGGWTRLTDAIKDDLLQANMLAREAAGGLGCAFGAGSPDYIYRRNDDGRVEAVDLSDDWFGLKRYPPWAFGLALAAAFGMVALFIAASRGR